MELKGGEMNDTEESETNSPEIFVRSIISAVTEYSAFVHSEDIKWGLRGAARKGRFLSAKAPYGFRKVQVEDDGAKYTSLEIDPQTGPVVRLIFSTNQDGAPEVDIAKEFNQRGISSPTGDSWKPLQIMKILRDDICCGTYVFGKTTKEPARIENAFPGIVTQEEFDQAQRVRRTGRL